jgi:hypothetical protein
MEDTCHKVDAKYVLSLENTFYGPYIMVTEMRKLSLAGGSCL